MRLIDADKLKASIEEKDRYNLGGENRIIVCGMLDDAPTIDAEPIIHAYWIEKKNRIICSNCGREVLYNSDYLPQTTHFCYNCGAKMSNGKDFDFNNSLLRNWE